MVANLAVHTVFFFERHLDTGALTRAFAHALNNLPIFAGRIAMVDGRMRIRCEGQGVPFRSVSSDCTLREAIRSASEDTGLWLIDPVNGATARWGLGPLCKVRVTHLADHATAIGFSWHHAIGDMQTAMHFMNAWAAAAADKPLAEPLLVEVGGAVFDDQRLSEWLVGSGGSPRVHEVHRRLHVADRVVPRESDRRGAVREMGDTYLAQRAPPPSGRGAVHRVDEP